MVQIIIWATAALEGLEDAADYIHRDFKRHCIRKQVENKIKISQ